MSSVKGTVTKTKGKSKVKLAIGNKRDKHGKEKKIPHAKWVEFRARLRSLAAGYGISVSPVRKKKASKK